MVEETTNKKVETNSQSESRYLQPITDDYNQKNTEKKRIREEIRK